MTPASGAWPDVPLWSDRIVHARNANEARLFVQVHGGEERESRAVGVELHLLAEHPEGPRVHRFTLGGGAPYAPTDLGEGHTQILDAVELLEFADRVVGELPPLDGRMGIARPVLRRLRLAAAALREAARLAAAPSGASGSTPATRDRSARSAHRLTVTALHAAAAAMDARIAEWERGPRPAEAPPRPPPPTGPPPIVEALAAHRAGTLAEDAFLRAVLRHPAWYVPVDGLDRPLLWTLGEQAFLAAQSRPNSPDGGEAQWLRVDGRHLVRHLPSDCGGVVFDLGTPAACVLERGPDGPAIAEMLGVLEVEDALAAPAPRQLQTLLAHAWFVLCGEGGEPLLDADGPHRVVHLASGADRMRRFVARRPADRGASIARAPGAALFARLARRADLDGVAVHWGDEETELLGPHAAGLFTSGVDGRSTARVLPARTIAELHLFLDLEGCSAEGRAHELGTLEGELVARYTGRAAQRQRSWHFQPVPPTADPLDLGPGASSILCAGQLADLLRRRLRVLPGDPWLLDATERQQAAVAARWAQELLKMTVDGCIPRSAVRSADGSRYLRELPEMGTVAWLVGAQRYAEALAAGP